MRFTRAATAFSMAAALAAAPAVAEPAASFSTGVEYQEGDYLAGDRVERFTIRNRVQYETGRIVLAASVPWVRIEAPGNVIGGGLLGLPIIVDPNQPGTRTVREGLGDVALGAGIALPPLAGIAFNLNGEVKLPTASERRGIGTGETDFRIGASASRRFGSLVPYMEIGYLMPGDPDAYDLRDSLSLRGGVAFRLADGLDVDLAYGHAESVSLPVPDERQLSTAVRAALSPRLSLGLYGQAGMSDGAADFGAGLSLGFRIF